MSSQLKSLSSIETTPSPSPSENIQLEDLRRRLYLMGSQLNEQYENMIESKLNTIIQSLHTIENSLNNMNFGIVSTRHAANISQSEPEHNSKINTNTDESVLLKNGQKD